MRRFGSCGIGVPVPPSLAFMSHDGQRVAGGGRTRGLTGPHCLHSGARRGSHGPVGRREATSSVAHNGTCQQRCQAVGHVLRDEVRCVVPNGESAAGERLRKTLTELEGLEGVERSPHYFHW